MNKIKLAQDMALKYHKGQRYGEFPYFYHLQQVAEVCKSFNLGEDAEILAWLHDIYEDTDISIDEVQLHFGRKISLALKDISNKDTPKETFRAISVNPLALKVKLCDRLINMQNSINHPVKHKYIKEYPLFKRELNIDTSHAKIWQALDEAYKVLLD